MSKPELVILKQLKDKQRQFLFVFVEFEWSVGFFLCVCVFDLQGKITLFVNRVWWFLGDRYKSRLWLNKGDPLQGSFKCF